MYLYGREQNPSITNEIILFLILLYLHLHLHIIGQTAFLPLKTSSQTPQILVIQYRIIHNINDSGLDSFVEGLLQSCLNYIQICIGNIELLYEGIGPKGRSYFGNDLCVHSLQSLSSKLLIIEPTTVVFIDIYIQIQIQIYIGQIQISMDIYFKKSDILSMFSDMIGDRTCQYTYGKLLDTLATMGGRGSKYCIAFT